MKILSNKTVNELKEMRKKHKYAKIVIDAKKEDKNIAIKSLMEELEKIYTILNIRTED